MGYRVVMLCRDQRGWEAVVIPQAQSLFPLGFYNLAQKPVLEPSFVPRSMC